MIGDMECIYESFNNKKKIDIKDFDLVVEWKSESKKRIIIEIKDENFNNFEKKKLNDWIKDLESLFKDIVNGFNLDFKKLGVKFNIWISEIWYMF